MQGEDSIEDFMDHVEGYEKGGQSPSVGRVYSVTDGKEETWYI